MKSVGTVKMVCVAGGIAVLSLVTFCGFQLPKLNSKYSVRQFFPKDHPVLKNDDDVERIFQLRSAPSFYAVVDLKVEQKGTWLEPERLSVLKKITQKFSVLSGVKSALSLGNVEMAINQKKELRIGTLDEALPPSKWAEYVRWQPLLRPQLISADGRSALIVIEPKTTTSTGLARLEKQVGDLLKRHAGSFTYGLAGVPAVQSRLSESLQNEVGKFVALSLLVFCAMFFLFYRNFAPVLFAGMGLLVCNIVVIGALSAGGISFTVLLSTLPIIVSIAFVSLAIHTLHLWADRLVEAGSPQGVLERWSLSLKTLREIALPNFMGSLTTAIGFLALVTAPIPAIRDYAWIIAVSVVATFALTQFAMIFALPWFTPVQRDWTRSRAWWTLTITRWSAPIFVAVIAFSVFFGAAGMKLNFSSKLFDDLPDREAVHVAMARIDQQFGGTVNLDVTIDAGRENAWNSPESLRRLQDALNEIRKLENVGAALGLTDFIGDQIPKSRAAAAETYFLFSMSSANPLNHFVDGGLRRTRLQIRMTDLPSSRIDRLRSDVRAILQSSFPQAQLIETGLAVNSHTINREVAHELVYGFWQSLLVIGLLLVFVFRSLRWALVACVPNLVPPAVLIGALAFLQTPIKPAIALIFSIALGLAFNNTVYLLMRLRRLRVGKEMSSLPLRRALLEEGNPCLSESLLMFAGFLIFLSSGFKLNQTFGAYMVLSIVAGALGDLVFLPALLKQFPDLLGGKPKAAQDKGDSSSKPGGGRGAMAAGLAGLLFFSVLGLPLKASAGEAEELLKKARAQVQSTSDSATVTLKIIESNGETKIRKMQMKTMTDGGTYRALVRIQSPADIKGTALLAEVKGGRQSQWLYLPSSRQVRRVVSTKTSGSGVLGSELNPDDLSSAALEGASARVVKKTAGKAWIEIKPKGGRSPYTRAILTMSLPQALPEKLDYQVGSKSKKTVEFKDYAVIAGVHRAKRIIVRNLENHRGTEVELADLTVNTPMKASDFSQSALKK